MHDRALHPFYKGNKIEYRQLGRGLDIRRIRRHIAALEQDRADIFFSDQLQSAVPYTGMIMSTRESEKTRRECLEIGITQISGGSRTSVGGYAEAERPEDTVQFDVEDRRTLGEVVDWLIDLGYIPSFCTACYREGRTGDRFMSLLKSGQIANCCQPNAMMTLKEFLMDYAGGETKKKGDAMIEDRLSLIPNETVRATCRRHLAEIEQGNRDFRF